MKHLQRYDPFAEIRTLQRHLFSDDWFTTPLLPQMRLATTDVYTVDDKQMVVEAHLPHFSEDDVNISVENGDLVIQAEKHEREEDKGKKYVVRESSSSFYRRIRLPQQVDQDGIEADMENGVLKVTVPFKSLPEPKKVAIKKSSKKLDN